MNTLQSPLAGFDSASPGLDAVFHTGTRLGHAVPEGYPTRPMATHYCHSLLRNPRDFACHSRRIDFLLDRGDSLALAAALTDLFLVLADDEPRWRQRLLALAGDRIPAEIAAYLAAPHGTPPVPLPDSLFAYGPASPGGADFSADRLGSAARTAAEGS